MHSFFFCSKGLYFPKSIAFGVGHDRIGMKIGSIILFDLDDSRFTLLMAGLCSVYPQVPILSTVNYKKTIIDEIIDNFTILLDNFRILACRYVHHRPKGLLITSLHFS